MNHAVVRASSVGAPPVSSRTYWTPVSALPSVVCAHAPHEDTMNYRHGDERDRTGEKDHAERKRVVAGGDNDHDRWAGVDSARSRRHCAPASIPRRPFE